MTIKRLGALIALFALLALAVSACGGGSDSTSSSSSTSESTAEGSEEGSSKTVKLSGEPYIIGGLTPVSGEGFNYPDWVAGGKAAVAAINEEGGIDGHPVEFFNCDDKNNPNEAGKCAREMISKGVIGVAGGATLYHENIEPVLKEANIAWVGPYAESEEQWNDENIFPIDGSAYSQSSAGAYALKLAGAKKVGLGFVESGPAAIVQYESFEAGTKALGLEEVPRVNWPLNAADFTPYVQQMINEGPEGVSLVALQLQALNFIKISGQLGAGFKITYSDGGLNPENFQTIGGEYDVYVTGGLPPVTAGETDPKQYPGVAEFREDMKKEAESGEKYAEEKYVGYHTLRTWLSVKVIAQVANEMKGEITGPKFTEALNAAKEVETGVIPPWTPGANDGPKGFKRLSNPYIYVSKVNPEGLPELVSNEPVDIVEEVGFSR